MSNTDFVCKLKTVCVSELDNFPCVFCVVPYRCPYCRYTSKHTNNMKKHIDAFHLGKTFTCSVCDKMLRFRETFERHMQRFHPSTKYTIPHATGVTSKVKRTLTKTPELPEKGEMKQAEPTEPVGPSHNGKRKKLDTSETSRSDCQKRAKLDVLEGSTSPRQKRKMDFTAAARARDCTQRVNTNVRPSGRGTKHKKVDTSDNDDATGREKRTKVDAPRSATKIYYMRDQGRYFCREDGCLYSASDTTQVRNHVRVEHEGFRHKYVPVYCNLLYCYSTAYVLSYKFLFNYTN